ncbi:MAG: helix-turn-helix transcriptional regulator [Pseudomonadales bacterium]|nr:helix-turn-helix transcriptional regulator [Pseudomonadales bacterium]
MNNKQPTRPIVALIDLLSKKWVLRMLWELNKGACTFRELQLRCGDVSPTIINRRIKDLHGAKLVSKSSSDGYKLTEQGEELIQLFYPVNEFATRWAAKISDEE